MAGEKYVVAATENSLQIAIRNILNPAGYIFLGNCNDSISLLRLIRSYNPDFVVVDVNIRVRELKPTLETIDDEMLCACVLIGEQKDGEVVNMIERSNTLLFCQKAYTREMLVHIVDMAMLNYKRVYGLNKKLREMTENYETRKAVERAKWILMKRNDLSENEAYERIRKRSMDSRMSMKSIAQAIIFTDEITNKPGGR